MLIPSSSRRRASPHRGDYGGGHRTTRHGTTLLEQLLVLVVVGVLSALAAVGAGRMLDAAAVHAVARDLADLLALARDEAVARGQRTAVRFDVARATVAVHAGADTAVRYDASAHGGVRFTSSRDSMAYAPSGLGYGAANLQVIVRKGASVETLTVSRLGRVRR